MTWVLRDGRILLLIDRSMYVLASPHELDFVCVYAYSRVWGGAGIVQVCALVGSRVRP